MNIYFTNESNETDSVDKHYVRNQMIAYNLKHFPDDLKGRYQEINLLLRKEDGQILGGSRWGNMLELAGDPLFVRG